MTIANFFKRMNMQNLSFFGGIITEFTETLIKSVSSDGNRTTIFNGNFGFSMTGVSGTINSIEVNASDATQFKFLMTSNNDIQKIKSYIDANDGLALLNYVFAGNDQLIGSDEGDIFSGFAGNDKLIGGNGADKLTGGLGKDIFKFNNTKESGITAITRDTITDFSHKDGDKIDLSAIDANVKLAKDQAFKFIGNANFSTNATAQLRFDTQTHILFGSRNTDKTPEFSILLTGVNELVAADFVL